MLNVAPMPMHPALADLLDDAVVAEGATDEVSHCLGSSGAMVSQFYGQTALENYRSPKRRQSFLII
jgi:hypothetical protein